MTKEEISLLLYLETCAVDYGGLVDMAHLNVTDMEITGKWCKENFIEFGRVCIADIVKRTNWVKLSKTAMHLASEYRKERAERMWLNRNWKTTEEKRNEDINADQERN